MKKLFSLLIYMLPIGLLAQEKGIQFEHELTWREVQEKAKSENKYIFMDCFTTWCAPCAYMATNIFPQEELGDFFNKHFISLKVQMDQTAYDDDYVKKWYNDAKEITDQYGISSFPTFLFFSPEGKLVHRLVGSYSTKDFLAHSSDALDPAKQYYTLQEEFNRNPDKKPREIRNKAMEALKNYDYNAAAQYAHEYLATQKDLLTKENIQFINQFTNSSLDDGFKVFLKNSSVVDKILGKGTAFQKIKTIILKEEIYPHIPKDGTSPDFKTIETNLTKKYPHFSKEVIAGFKVQYYRGRRDWPKFEKEVRIYLSKYGRNETPERLNSFARIIFEYCASPACLQEGIKWSRNALRTQESPAYMSTYASLLYKTGKKEEAIAILEKAIALSREDRSLQHILEKMKNGEKIWKN